MIFLRRTLSNLVKGPKKDPIQNLEFFFKFCRGFAIEPKPIITFQNHIDCGRYLPVLDVLSKKFG